jgi:hypothetical protein
MLSRGKIEAASDFLWRLWSEGRRTDEIPSQFRPQTRAEGYAIQALVERKGAKPLFGWKIAATSACAWQRRSSRFAWRGICIRGAIRIVLTR